MEILQFLHHPLIVGGGILEDLPLDSGLFGREILIQEEVVPRDNPRQPEDYHQPKNPRADVL
jgi:hypothetical protein